ncbi:MAG: hypothetical protein U1E65_33185 [Myxococcota bacterium]
MTPPRRDKPAPAHAPIDAGPSFEADSLVVPEGLDREGLGGRRPAKKQKASVPAWVMVSGLGLVAILGIGVWLHSRAPARSVSVEPLADPETPPPGPAAAAAVSPSASPMPSPSQKAEPSAAPAARPEESPAGKEPGAKEPGVARPKRPKGAKGGSNDPAQEEAVDEALARLSQQSGAELRQQGKLDAARLAFVKECDEGRGASCEALAQMADRGEGGDRDPKQVKDAQEKGCNARSATSCLAVAQLYKQDPATRQLAAEKLAAACSYASAQGCREAAEMLEANHDAGSDARALSLRSRACALGDKESCRAVKAATSSVP